MKKLMALFFVLLLCMGLFAGCGDKEDSNSASSTAGPSADDGIFSTEDVAFVDADGKSNYSIVRASEVTSAVTSIVTETRKKIIAVIGSSNASSLKNLSDETDGTDQYEILIGMTNRSETKQAKDYLIASTGGRVNDYIIATIGKKIVIYAMSETALQTACDYFVANYIKLEGVKGGIKYVYATEGSYTECTVNGVKLSNYCVVKPRFNIPYVVQLQIETMVEELTETTGYSPEIVEDNIAAADYEIIVGSADREGVTAVANRDEYSIVVSDKKIYLNGGSPAATAMAVSELCKMLKTGKVEKTDSVTAASYETAVASYDKSKYYIPTWVDDFDYYDGGVNGIDTTKWRVLEMGEDSNPGQNGRTSVRTSDILKVEDGVLKAYAGYDSQYYYGFKLKTDTTMTYRYGILEMSAILPHGDAFWISLWANSYEPESPAAYMTEINVVEMFGNSASEASNCHGWLRSERNDVYEAVWKPQGYPDHWSLDSGFSGDKRYSCPEGKFNDGFHTFTYIWDENTCAFACDGNLYFSLDLNADPVYKDTLCQRLHLILSEAVCFASGSGKNMADDAPEWTESNNFEIDYVHIYQLDDGKSELVYNPRG